VADDSLIPFFVFDACDTIYFYLLYLFVTDVTHANFILGLGEVDYFFVGPESSLGAFS
jgi:hypothetical protein